MQTGTPSSAAASEAGLERPILLAVLPGRPHKEPDEEGRAGDGRCGGDDVDREVHASIMPSAR